MDYTPTLADETAITALLHAVREAFNARDIEKAISLHTENVILMESNMPAITGRQALKEFFTAYFHKLKMQNSGLQLSFSILEMEVICNRAFARGRVEVITGKQGHEPVRHTGKFLCLFQKQPDGTWLRSHIVSNTDSTQALN